MFNRLAKMATAVTLLACLTQVPTPALAASPTARGEATILTLAHLKDGSYQIPDLACGYTTVKLKEGVGQNDGVKVVFGRAIFASLPGSKTATAIVHMAYHTDELGWLQQLVFVQARGKKLLQVAEYTLDDRAILKELSIKDGAVWLKTETLQTPQPDAQLVPFSAIAVAPEESTVALGNIEPSDAIQGKKLTKLRLSSSKQGYLLQSDEYVLDNDRNEMVASARLSPYLSAVEERVGRLWSPTSRDRGEHVGVTFTIKGTGEVKDLYVSRSSEVASADLAALEAIQAAAPFPPLPQRSERAVQVCLDFQAGVSVKQ